MTRVIHTGDTHLGYAQYHSQARREDFQDAFEQVIDDAVDEDADAVVHAGDLFHDRQPGLGDLLGTVRLLRRLRDAGIPFLAVVGNHESTRGGQWLDLFADLGLAERLGAEPRLVGDVALYGLDHVPKSRRSELAYDFAPHGADRAALVAHGLFTPFAHADWETETVLEEATVDFEAVLLGDNHEPGTERVDDTWVTYCGSTERASAAEETARGYNLVTFDGDVEVRRRTLDTRPFAFVSVTLAPGEGAERVHEQLRQHDVTDAVAVVEITGEGEPVTPAAIEESLTERGALIARVTDRREREDDVDLDVSFADPDDAVEDRIRELGLSAAALDVDGAVRTGTTPDSNVRETVKSRVEARLDDGDGAAFRPAAEGAGAVGADDAGGGDTDAGAGTSETSDDDGDEPSSNDIDESSGNDGDGSSGDANDATDEEPAGDDPPTGTGTGPDGDDTQITLEDL